MDTIEIVQLIYTFWLRNKNEYSRLCLTINNSCEVKSHLCIANNIWRIQHFRSMYEGKIQKTRESICEILQEESGQRFRETVLQLGSQNCLSEIRK